MKITRHMFMAIALASILTLNAFSQTLEAAQIIERHLDSIGTKQKRESLKNLMAIGTSEFESKNPYVKGGGRGVLVSDRGNLMFILSFNSKDYPFEKIGYFGSEVNIPFATAGRRSLLGSFLMEHTSVVEHGLFSGPMSLRWVLTDPESRKAKLRAGTSKTDRGEAYTLDYSAPKMGASEFKIKLYFDAKTFEHIRTEYKREIPAGRIVFGQQNQISGSTLSLTEDFSDYKSANGLNLPYSYRVKFTSNSGASVVENSWGIKVVEFRVDQPLTSDFFSFAPAG
jgi:hypothetical protein